MSASHLQSTRLTMNLLRPSRLELPTQSKLDILQQMTGNLDSANVGWMPLRPNVVVLQDSRCVEEMDKRFCRLSRSRHGLGESIVSHWIAEVRFRVEHGDHVADLVDEAFVRDGRECVAGSLKAEPEGLRDVSGSLLVRTRNRGRLP